MLSKEGTASDGAVTPLTYPQKSRIRSPPGAVAFNIEKKVLALCTNPQWRQRAVGMVLHRVEGVYFLQNVGVA